MLIFEASNSPFLLQSDLLFQAGLFSSGQILSRGFLDSDSPLIGRPNVI